MFIIKLIYMLTKRNGIFIDFCDAYNINYLNYEEN